MSQHGNNPSGSVYATLMPTVLRIEGYEIAIYFRDHLPAHVHVVARWCEAVIDLGCPDGEPEIREFYRFKSREMKPILELVKRHQTELCAMWKEIHGNF